MNKDIKPTLFNSTKAQIIVHVLDYIDSKDAESKNQAIATLIVYSKYYKISLKKKKILPDLKKHLKDFILNKKGYLITLENLFNSLNND